MRPKNAYELLTDVRTIIREHVEGDLTDTWILRFMNMTITRIWSEEVTLHENIKLATYTFSIVSGQELYDLPTDFFKSFAMEYYDTDQWLSLDKIARVDRHHYVSDTGVIDPVFRYYTGGQQIGIVPVPSTSLVDGLRLLYVPQFLPVHYGELAGYDEAAGTLTFAEAASSISDSYNDAYVDVWIAGSTQFGRALISDYDGPSRVATVSGLSSWPSSGTVLYATLPRHQAELDAAFMFRAGAIALTHDSPGEATKLMDLFRSELHAQKIALENRNEEPEYVTMVGGNRFT